VFDYRLQGRFGRNSGKEMKSQVAVLSLVTKQIIGISALREQRKTGCRETEIWSAIRRVFETLAYLEKCLTTLLNHIPPRSYFTGAVSRVNNDDPPNGEAKYHRLYHESSHVFLKSYPRASVGSSVWFSSHLIATTTMSSIIPCY
jgi:hypothetical protein